MRKNLFILIFLISLAACTSLIQDTELTSTPAHSGEASETNEETSTETLTPFPQSTATGTDIPIASTASPTGTFTPFPIPSGLLSHEELEQRMQDWISGEIEFTDADRLLDEHTGQGIRLGVLAKDPIESVVLVFYNLGFGLVEDQEGNPYLINLVGFEDAGGKRFTAVFHTGRLDDQAAIIRLLKWQGKRIKRAELISFEQLPPEDFANICGELPLSVFIGSTNLDGLTGHEGWNNYLTMAKDVAEALTDFLLCDDCSFKDTPANLESIIDTIPKEFSENVPYLYGYQIAY